MYYIRLARVDNAIKGMQNFLLSAPFTKIDERREREKEKVTDHVRYISMVHKLILLLLYLYLD